MDTQHNRREILRSAGLVSTALLAGCSSGDDSGQNPDTTTATATDSATATSGEPTAATTTETGEGPVYSGTYFELEALAEPVGDQEPKFTHVARVPDWPDAYTGDVFHTRAAKVIRDESWDGTAEIAATDGEAAPVRSSERGLLTPVFHEQDWVIPFLYGDDFFDSAPSAEVRVIPEGEYEEGNPSQNISNAVTRYNDTVPSSYETHAFEGAPYKVGVLELESIGWPEDESNLHGYVVFEGEYGQGATIEK